ncbi:MAG: hypothetical protein ACLFQX_05360 [Candidatus Kapaibacterium sp.]
MHTLNSSLSHCLYHLVKGLREIGLTYDEYKIVDTKFDGALAGFGLSPVDYEKMSIEEIARLEAE